jgi:SAM-dependent methyltransferase
VPSRVVGPIEGDAWGQALLAAVDGRESVIMVERDDGLIEPDLFVGRNYYGEPDSWSDRDHWAIERAVGKVLDLGAGGGRVTLALQAAGRDVVALDVSPGAIEVCRRRGVQQCFLGSVDDLVETSPTPFDSIVALGNNLGLLGSRTRANHLLNALAAISAPDAVIVGTGIDPYATDDLLHLAYHEANRQAGRLPGQVTIRVRHRGLATPWSDWLWCSIDELAELCEPTPWRIADTYPGPTYAVALTRV